MARQNIQFIKILYAKINQGKNKTFMHNESLYKQYLTKIPQLVKGEFDLAPMVVLGERY